MQPTRRPDRLLAWLLPAATALLAGCTTVVIHSDGGVKTESRFGIVHIGLDPARNSAVAVSGFGAMSLPGSFTLGYTRWQGVALERADGDRCLVVIFDSPQQPGVEK